MITNALRKSCANDFDWVLKKWWLLIGRLSLFSFPEASSGRLLFGLFVGLVIIIRFLPRLDVWTRSKKIEDLSIDQLLNYQTNDNE